MITNIKKTMNANHIITFQFKSLKQNVYITKHIKHFFCKNNITILYNGNISNKDSIISFLKIKKFKISEDIDIIYHLIIYFQSLHSQISFIHIINMVMEHLKGYYSIIIHHKQYKNKIFMRRHKSFIFVGYNKKKTNYMITSDQSNFTYDIDFFYQIDSDKTLILDTSLDNIPLDIKLYNYKNLYKNTKFNLHHQMLDITNYFNTLDEKIILNSKHIIFITDIRSYHSVVYSIMFMKKYLHFNNIQVIKTTSFYLNNIPKTDNSLVIFISLYDKLDYIHDIIKLLKTLKLYMIAFVSNNYLDIVNMVDSVMYIPNYNNLNDLFMYKFIVKYSLFILFGLSITLKKKMINLNYYQNIFSQMKSILFHLNSKYEYYKKILVRDYFTENIKQCKRIIISSNIQYRPILKEIISHISHKSNKYINYYKIDDLQYIDDVDNTILMIVEENDKYVNILNNLNILTNLNHTYFINKKSITHYTLSKKQIKFFNNLQNQSILSNYLYLIPLFNVIFTKNS